VVLVVDDEAPIGRALRKLLERALPGVEVLSATSGPEALALLDRRSVDLILSDYRMPGMNGVEFLVASHKPCPHVPRVLLTAFPDLNVVLQSLNEARIDKFLMKPWESEELVATIGGLLERRRAAAESSRVLAKSVDSMRRMLG
jgi:response regulator RpfG family c-di-GMP phosphodiesterase